MNDLEKLAKEKYSGDLVAAWRYVLYECSQEERDKYMKYVSKEQLDIGALALKKNGFNEVDQLAKQKFNGNMQETWYYIFSSCSTEEIERYLSMADSYQVGQIVLLLNSLREKDKKLSNNVMSLLNIQDNLSSLRLSQEEVLNAKKNPYKVDIMKSLFKMILTSSSIVALAALGAPVLGLGAGGLAVAEGILGLVNTSFAFDIADKLPKYFKFKKTQNALLKENGLDSDSMRRGM